MKQKSLLKTMLLLLIVFIGGGIFSSAFAQVSSASPQDGKSYVVAAYINNKYYALPNTTTNGGTIAGTEVTLNSINKVSTTNAAGKTWTLEEGKSANAGYFYIKYTSGSDTYCLYKNGTGKDNYNFALNKTSKNTWSFTANGTGYTVAAVDRGSNNIYIQCNSGTFRCYSTATPIILLEIGDEPVDTRTPIATINSLSPTSLDLGSTDRFTSGITPAEGKTASDYTVSYTTTAASSVLSIAVGTANYTVGSTKAYVTVKVTVTPTSANESTHKEVSKEFDVKLYDLEANDGTATKPFTVAEAIAFYDDIDYNANTEYYVKGWIDKLGTYNSSTHKYSYYISDDGTTTGDLQIYTGKNLDNTDFTAASNLEEEDYVVVYGKLGKSGTTKRIADGNYITTLNRREKAGFSFANEQLNAYPNQSPFTGSVLGNPNNVTVTYSTSNSDIADVNATTGAITIGSNTGTATITATYTGTITPTVSTYKTTTATYKIKVAREENGLTFPASPNVTTHANDADVTEPTLTNPNNLSVTWSSTDEEVATVDANGQVTTHEKEGTTTIKATYTQSDQYKGGEVSYKVTVERGDLTFAYSGDVSGKKAEITAPSFSNPENVSGIVFASSYSAVASVDATTGAITLGDATGTAVITATFAQNDYYHAHNASCTVVILPAEDVTEPPVPGNYQKISSTADLADGANYLIVCEEKNKAMGGQNGDYRDAVTVTINSNTITDAGNATVVTLVQSGEKWKLQFDNGKYYTTTAAKKMSEGTAGTEATITFSSNNAIINFGSTPGILYYNSGSPRFLNYSASAQDAVQLYKFVPGETPANIDIYVSAAGYATYASNFDLNYTSESGLEAYIAKDVNGAIKLQQVNRVPAGTGVLLKATDGGGDTYTVPVATGDMDAMTGNLFVRGTGATVASTQSNPTRYNYILNVVNNQIGFYMANGQMVATNRAYLQLDNVQSNGGGNARIDLIFEDASGIADMNREATTNNRYFDLQGRQVAQPAKGLYIVNGKKVLVR